jgi:hypothetical protein
VSRPGCAVRVAAIAAWIGASPWASAATAPSAGDLAHCAGIAAPDARLACYDALAGRSADRVHSAPVTPSPASPASAGAAAAASTAATSAAPLSAAPPPPASTPASDPRTFGLTQAQLHAAPEGPAAIHARVVKIVDNRVARGYVVLDNGQTWTLTDPGEDMRLGPGDSVTITRASLGSFLMVTQSKRSYHVRRTQ